MHGMRSQHDAAVKARVALEAIKGEKTIAQIAMIPPVAELDVASMYAYGTLIKANLWP